MRALHRRREDVIACQGSSGRAVDRHKKRSSVSISRASGDWCALRIIQPSSGPGSDKTLPGARAVGRLKTQGHDPLFHAIQQLLRHDIDAALAVLQTNGRDIVAADAAVEAVAKGTQVVEMAGRNHHLNTGSIKPLTYLLSQLRHLLTKHGDIRGGRPVEGRCPPRILLLLQFLKKLSLAVTLSPVL